MMNVKSYPLVLVLAFGLLIGCDRGPLVGEAEEEHLTLDLSGFYQQGERQECRLPFGQARLQVAGGASLQQAIAPGDTEVRFSGVGVQVGQQVLVQIVSNTDVPLYEATATVTAGNFGGTVRLVPVALRPVLLVCDDEEVLVYDPQREAYLGAALVENVGLGVLAWRAVTAAALTLTPDESELAAGDAVDVAIESAGPITTPRVVRFEAAEGFVDVAVRTANAAPFVEEAIPDHDLFVDDSLLVDLTSVFRDPDGDALTFTATQRMPNNQEVALQVEAGRLIVQGLAEGAALIDVTATDPAGEAVRDAFAVTVALPPLPDLAGVKVVQTGAAYYPDDPDLPYIIVPVEIVVENQGAAPAGPFKVTAEGLLGVEVQQLPFTDQVQVFPSLFTDLDLPDGDAVTFFTHIGLPEAACPTGATLRITADSCVGDQGLPLFCRVRESDEGNNLSGEIKLELPQGCAMRDF